MLGAAPRRVAQRSRQTVHLRTTPSRIHSAVRLKTGRGLILTPIVMFYSGILSCAALAIITTSPCGWVCALTCVDNAPGDNYGHFTVEWWTPMNGRSGGQACPRE